MELNAENIINEIQSLIKALKDCGGWVKRGNGEGWFNHEILADALALINSQEQRIGELEKRLCYLLQSKTIAEYDEVDIHTKEYVKDIHSLDANIKALTEENERLARLANLRQRDLDNTNDLLFKVEDEIERLKAQKYYIHSDGRIEMIPTVESVRADTVREMQERLKADAVTIQDHTGKLGVVVGVGNIDDVAREMLEGENEN